MLKVINAPKVYDQNIAFKNCAFHNSQDFYKKELLLCYEESNYRKNIFRSITDDKNIKKGELYISRQNRTFYNLELDTKISCTEYIPKANPKGIKEMLVQINIIGNNSITVHEEFFSTFLKETLSNAYFYGDQIYIVNYDNKSCVLNTRVKQEGYITSRTKFTFVSQNINVKVITSSLLRPELFSPKFNFKNYGLGGLNNEMQKIFTETLSTRSISPELIKIMNLKHVKGILLYGPPGTGKTLIARNLGRLLTDTEPTVINGPEVISSYVGKSEENIRLLFQNAINDYREYKEKSKLHIFIFDEIDAICKRRGQSSGTLSNVNDNIVNQLLSLIDGVNALDNIFIIAMTNRMELLDSALLRAGRIEVHIKINLPDLQGRVEILNIHTKKIKDNNMLSNINIEELATKTENYSGAEIEALVRKAISYAINEKLSNKGIKKEDIIIKMDHFMRAITIITPLFGNDSNSYKDKIQNVLMLSEEYERKYNMVLTFLNYNKRVQLQSMLIYGDKGIGKSTFVNLIACKAQITYTKIIRAIDIVTMTDSNKIEYLVTILREANLSNRSLIIIDDIEIFLEYSFIDTRSIYSIKLFNSLLTLLKFNPEINNNIRIIVNCGNSDLAHILEPYFDKYISHDYISEPTIKNLATTLEIKDYDPTFIMTIKNLLDFS